MELINDKMALLDKICIGDFKIIEIDNLLGLQKAGIVTVIESQSRYVVLDTGEYFSKLQIDKTEFFDSFIVGTGKGKRSSYGRMEMSIRDEEFHNLNCYTVVQYLEKIEEARIFLKEEYGINVDFSRATFKSMEINKTIMLDDQFERYYRPIRLMMCLFPLQLRFKNEVEWANVDLRSKSVREYKKDIPTYTRDSGDKGIMIKVYDKSRQLRVKFQICIYKEYLRFEITLKSGEKIKKIFGDNLVRNVTDFKINMYFLEFIRKNVEIPYQKYCEGCKRELKKILQKYYEPCSRTWTRDVLAEIREAEIKRNMPLMLDINELTSQIGCLKIKSKQNRHEIKKRFEDLCVNQDSIFCQGDDKKYEELIKKLLIYEL